MALSKGFVTTAATTSLDGRLLDQALITRNAADAPRAGVLYGAINPISSTASMNVSIADQVVLALTRGSGDGVTIVTNVGAATVTLAAAPLSNSRYDVVYAKHNDTEKGDANSLPVFDKVTGTAAASPVVPSAPAGALVLGTVLVPAGAAATNATGVVVSNTVFGTALAGSPIRYRSIAEMRADTPNVIDGTLGYIKSAGMYYLRNGVWGRYDSQAFARVTMTGSANSSSSTTTLGSATTSSTTNDSGLFDLSGGSVIRVIYSGWYDVRGGCKWQSNATGERYIEITANDTSFPAPLSDRRSTATAGDGSISTIEHFNAGEFVKLKGQQNSGATLTYTARLSAAVVSLD
jgi:hypothetical protein